MKMVVLKTVCALKTGCVFGGHSLQMHLWKIIVILFLAFHFNTEDYAGHRSAPTGEPCAFLKTHCFHDLISAHQKYLEQSAFSVS